MRRFAAVFAASFLSSAAMAQVKETILVNLVEVPVTVVDRAGNPIRGLAEKNFELFDDGKDTLIIYNFMYGPEAARPCPSCTSILDSLDGEAPHVAQRANLAVVAKSPIERIREFAKERGWRNLRLLSSQGSTYNHDYQGENAKGEQMPALNVFVRRNGKIYHFYNTELMFAPADPGQDMRHVDMIWPLWNLFDVTPEGRGTKWKPALSY